MNRLKRGGLIQATVASPLTAIARCARSGIVAQVTVAADGHVSPEPVVTCALQTR